MVMDRVQFQDFMKLLSKVLDNYVNVEESDVQEITDVVRSRIK